jgi:hypothetical protein
MKTKTLDCVEMQHHGANETRKKIEKMTREEELIFWRERSKVLKQRQERVGEERRTSKNEESQTSRT